MNANVHTLDYIHCEQLLLNKGGELQHNYQLPTMQSQDPVQTPIYTPQVT